MSFVFKDNRSLFLAIVIGLFLVYSACYLRCSLIYIMKDEQPCNDKKFKLPLLVLNSAINQLLALCLRGTWKRKQNDAFAVWSERRETTLNHLRLLLSNFASLFHFIGLQISLSVSQSVCQSASQFVNRPVSFQSFRKLPSPSVN